MPSPSDLFLRFVTPHGNAESGYPSGLFMAAWDVRHAVDTCAYDRERLRLILVWFGANLREPERFWRTSAKGADRRNWHGLSWFKDSAVDHVAHMYEMANVLFDYGYPCDVLRTSRPGFIVYEDAYQVVAEPFADTPVG